MRALRPHDNLPDVSDAYGSLNEKLVPAKNGYTLQAGETAIHSRYDPVSEAEKYITSLCLKPYKFFILIEPGLGYLSATLNKYFPMACIVSLHCSPFFKEKLSLPDNNDNKDKALTGFGLSWNPYSKETLEDFLETTLADSDAEDIKLIEWKPSINAYGKLCLDLAARTVECIRRISAGRKTTRFFGRRWLKNALRNLELVQYQAEPLPGSVPVLVCAAGPSLEESLHEIKIWKQSHYPPFIIAVSSAASALLYRGICPDLIITTDGGPWALFHLVESFRQYENQNVPQNNKPVLAFSLTAALPSQAKTWSALVLRDGSLWQEILLKSHTSLAFPQRGTVSAAAIDLALYISTGSIYMCGLDFAHRDLLTHSRPYAFEQFLQQDADRKQPLYSQIFKREESIRRSGSHGIYAAWFTAHGSSYPKRLYTMGKSAHGIPSKKPDINETGERIRFTVRQTAEKPDRKGLIGALIAAIDNPQLSGQICKELGELLLSDTPTENNKYADLVRKALLELQ